MKHIKVILLIGGLFFANAGGAQSPRMFSCNYDAVLIVDGSFSELRSRVQLRNGSMFPIEMQGYKLQIQVTGIPHEDKYTINLSIFKNSQDTWFEVNSQEITFDGSYGIPLEYKWAAIGVQLDLALVVSPSWR